MRAPIDCRRATAGRCWSAIAAARGLHDGRAELQAARRSTTPDAFRGRDAGARADARVARPTSVGDGVRGRAAARADHDRARSRTTTCGSPRRASCRRRRSSASREPTSFRPSTAQAAGQGQHGVDRRRRARCRTVGVVQLGGSAVLGARLLGQVPARHRSGARARCSPASGAAARSSRAWSARSRAATSRCARSICELEIAHADARRRARSRCG